MKSKYLYLIVLLLFALSLYYLSVRSIVFQNSFVHSDKYLFHGETMLNASENYTRDTLDGLVCYNVDGNLPVYAAEVGTHTKSQVITCIGNMAYITPFDYIAGTSLTYEDGNGCVISKKAALTLFQNTNILNMPVTVNQKTYYIRGVLDTNQSLILLGSNDSNSYFSKMQISFADKRNEAQNSKLFLNACGIYEDFTILDGSFIVNLIFFIGSIPICISLYLIITSFLALKKGDFIFTLLIFIYFAFFLLSLPDNMIPPKWSDFHFYSNKWADIKRTVFIFQNSSPSYKLISLQKTFVQTILYTFLSSVFTLVPKLLYFIHSASD